MNMLTPSKPSPTVLPPAQAPTPLPDDDAMQAARKKAIAAQTQRSGRSSTILSQADGDKLGG